MTDRSLQEVPLPSGWPGNVKPAVLHVISLAHYAIAAARGWAANSINARVRLTAERDQAITKASQLEEISRIKDARILIITQIAIL